MPPWGDILYVLRVAFAIVLFGVLWSGIGSILEYLTRKPKSKKEANVGEPPERAAAKATAISASSFLLAALIAWILWTHFHGKSWFD